MLKFYSKEEPHDAPPNPPPTKHTPKMRDECFYSTIIRDSRSVADVITMYSGLQAIETNTVTMIKASISGLQGYNRLALMHQKLRYADNSKAK